MHVESIATPFFILNFFYEAETEIIMLSIQGNFAQNLLHVRSKN